MASAATAGGAVGEDALVVVHAPLEAFSGARGAEVESGPPVPTMTLERL